MGDQMTKAADRRPSSPSPENWPDGQSPPPANILGPDIRNRRQLKSLERSLKVFLRASNLPGLEYRLRLAGYYTVNDLLDADMESLCAKGFTGLMSRRLLAALDEYIRRHLEQGPYMPFQMIRKGQNISVEPSDRVKAMPTYGKRNVKRRKSLTESVGKPALVSGRKIRLMSEEALNVQHFVTTPSQQAPTLQPMTSEETDYGLRSFSHDSLISTPSFASLRRVASVPADYRWTGGQPNETDPFYWSIHHHVRHYSCPPSLPSLETNPPPTLDSFRESLNSSGDADSTHTTLQLLLLLFRTQMCTLETLEVVVRVLERFPQCPEIAEQSCRIIKYITRRGTPQCGSLPPETMSAVIEVMDCNPASARVQLQATLAMGNIGRADPDQCRVVMFNGGVQSIAVAIETFDSHSELQVAAMSALAVTLANVPVGRIHFLSDYGYVLDLVISAIEGFPRDPQVQQYACTFLALLITEVADQVESGVMQLMVECVAVAMATHPHDHHVTLWGSKFIAHAACNAASDDWKLVARCCELLIEAMKTFPEHSDVQKWAAYALYQLAMYHRSDVCELLIQSGAPSFCEKPCPGLNSEALNYLQHLARLMDSCRKK